MGTSREYIDEKLRSGVIDQKEYDYLLALLEGPERTVQRQYLRKPKESLSFAALRNGFARLSLIVALIIYLCLGIYLASLNLPQPQRWLPNSWDVILTIIAMTVAAVWLVVFSLSRLYDQLQTQVYLLTSGLVGIIFLGYLVNLISYSIMLIWPFVSGLIVTAIAAIGSYLFRSRMPFDVDSEALSLTVGLVLSVAVLILGGVHAGFLTVSLVVGIALCRADKYVEQSLLLQGERDG